jgi:hypothetical protein
MHQERYGLRPKANKRQRCRCSCFDKIRLMPFFYIWLLLGAVGVMISDFYTYNYKYWFV